MRPIRWLHVSDFHFKVDTEWSQNVVLNSLLDEIRSRRENGVGTDFIVVTGDIAYSGKSEEYELALDFFNELEVASGVGAARIFCVPGNHDVDRSLETLSFIGARSHLSSPQRVDEFLAGGDNFNTLVRRQENYRDFERSISQGDTRIVINGGLGYVASFDVDGIQIAIVGLNSAWLAEGGEEDHGRLLMGERHVIDALEAVNSLEDQPHVVLGIAHHPLYLMKEFDHNPVQNRLDDALDFYHCGHLHQSDTRSVGSEAFGCLTITAGACYQSRDAKNSFSVLDLHLFDGDCQIETIDYEPTRGQFKSAELRDFPFEASPVGTCDVIDLGNALGKFCPDLESISFYLSALVIGKKSEIPIPYKGHYVFGSFDALETFLEGEMQSEMNEFRIFRNVLRVHFDRVPLDEILDRYGYLVTKYGQSLLNACHQDDALRDRLFEHDEDARTLGGSTRNDKLGHTVGLFKQLLAEKNWQLLRQVSGRHIHSSDLGTRTHARRMMALALSASTETPDRLQAIDHYQGLMREDLGDATDLGNLAILLHETGDSECAAETVFEGIIKFPEKSDSFAEIGRRIAIETGNAELRTKVDQATRTNDDRN